MSRGPLQLLISWFAQPLAMSIGWSLVHFLWQGMIVALLLAPLLRAQRRAKADVRYLAASGALLLMLASFLGTIACSIVLSARPPAEEGRVGLSRETERTDAARRNGATTGMAQAEATPIPGTPVASAPRSLAARALLPWFVAVWLLGVLGLSARHSAGWVLLQWMRRRRVRPAALELEAILRRVAERVRVSRAVLLLESSIVEVPAVIGWLRPLILVPVGGLPGLTPRQLEAIFAHELAHVRRHDYLVNLIQTAIETLLFFHPAVWWISRVIRAEREVCCDEIAVGACGGRLEYAYALASLEDQRGSRPNVLVAADGGPLLDRIRRVLGLPSPQPGITGWSLLATIAAGVLATITTGGFREFHAERPADDPRPPAHARNHDVPKVPDLNPRDSEARSRYYRELAAYHSSRAFESEAEERRRHPPPSVWLPGPFDPVSLFHRRKAEEYERAALSPWISVDNEPPPLAEPDDTAPKVDFGATKSRTAEVNRDEAASLDDAIALLRRRMAEADQVDFADLVTRERVNRGLLEAIRHYEELELRGKGELGDSLRLIRPACQDLLDHGAWPATLSFFTEADNPRRGRFSLRLRIETPGITSSAVALPIIDIRFGTP